MTRSILITGCSSGIGADAARRLASEGWQVIATCRAEADCARLREDGFSSFVLDHEDTDTIAAAFERTLEATGGTLDAVFLNGAYAIPAPLQDLPTPAMRAIFEANFIGWHDVARRAIPVMRAQGHGRILFNSSVLGFIPAKYRGAYIATKYAVEGYCATLRLELHGTGVHAVSIQPGPIATAFRANAIKQFERWIDWEASPLAPAYRSHLLDKLYKGNSGAAFELPASAVTDAVRRALMAKRPRPQYRVTLPTKTMALAKRALPTAVFERMCDRV